MVVPRILLIEENLVTRESVADALRRENIHVEAAEDCERVLGRYLEGGTSGFDLLLLDTDLSSVDGLGVCQELRAKISVPIVILSARDDETSIVVGLEVGADDYITKPFSMRELTSRVKAHLRRQRRNIDVLERHVLELPGLKIDPLGHQVLAQGHPVEMSAAQFRILTLLASHPGRVYSREQIMESVWGNGWFNGSRSIDVHIQNIRRKIEPDPANPRHIRTVRGTGYRFAEGTG